MCPRIREVALHLQLVDGEVDRDPNVLEDRVVGASNRRPTGRRRESSGHEDAVRRVELFDPTRVPGVEGCLIVGQQRVKLFLGAVLRSGNGAWDGGKKREWQQQCGEARAMCHLELRKCGGDWL